MSELGQENTEALKTWADTNNSFCVFATLCELSSLLDPSIPVPTPQQLLTDYERLYGMRRSGAVSPSEFFDVLKTFTRPQNMVIRRVTANPSFIDKFVVPDDIGKKLQVVTGMQRVEYPNMRVLAKERKKQDWVTHAETDDDAERFRTRIEPMLQKGCINNPGGLVGFYNNLIY